MNRDSKLQQVLATVTIPPMIAPLNKMVNVVIKEEGSAEDMRRSSAVSVASVEDKSDVKFDKKGVVEAGNDLHASQTGWP